MYVCTFIVRRKQVQLAFSFIFIYQFFQSTCIWMRFRYIFLTFVILHSTLVCCWPVVWFFFRFVILQDSTVLSLFIIFVFSPFQKSIVIHFVFVTFVFLCRTLSRKGGGRGGGIASNSRPHKIFFLIIDLIDWNLPKQRKK